MKILNIFLFSFSSRSSENIQIGNFSFLVPWPHQQVCDYYLEFAFCPYAKYLI